MCDGDEEQVKEDEGEDVGRIQSGGGRQENSLRDYSLNFERPYIQIQGGLCVT